MQMESFYDILRQESSQIAVSNWDLEIEPDAWIINLTREDFEGDYTLVVFPLSGRSEKAPHEIARQMGEALCDRIYVVDDFNIIKGFVNLSLGHDFWYDLLDTLLETEQWGGDFLEV